MSTTLKLLPSGTHIQATCEQCGYSREELVNPAFNPEPFSFQPNCAKCGEPLAPDMEMVIGIQVSYMRVLHFAKKTAHSLRTVGGLQGGESPSSLGYSAFSRADAEIKPPPLEDAQANHRVGADINQGVSHAGLSRNHRLH